MFRSAAISFILFMVLDAIWFGFIIKSVYLKEFESIGRISDGQFNVVYWAAAAVYVLLAAGLTYFVLSRFDDNTSFLTAFITGAFMGLVVYGVYDMTNHATLKDFSLRIAFIDMAWGTFATGTVTALTHWINSYFK